MSETTKTRDQVSIVTDAVNDFMEHPALVRGFLLDLMSEALRLGLTPEWEMEDNFQLTDGVVADLGTYLPSDLNDAELRGLAALYDFDDPWDMDFWGFGKLNKEV